MQKISELLMNDTLAFYVVKTVFVVQYRNKHYFCITLHSFS